jgi:tetratricopeptide (TPR) repeat protein
MTKTFATRTGRTFLALCAAGLLSGAPALAADTSDVETAPEAAQAATPEAAQPDATQPEATQPEATQPEATPMTAMAEPTAAMPAQQAAAPGASPSEAPAVPAAKAPAFGKAVAAALNDYYHGDFRGAADRLNAAAAANPTDPAAPYFLGYTYYRMGEFARSRTAFAQAYRIDPHFSPEPPASK